MGLSVADLKLLTIGFVMDMMTETGNDDFEYDQIAAQDDFDAF